MAKIKSVVTSSGKRVQVGSKAYDKRITQGGETAVSGTGKNLTNKDIKGIGGGFTDKVSTTFAKQQANAQGEQLPYQQFNEQIGGMGQTTSQALQQAPTPNTIQTGQPSPKTAEAGKGLPGAVSGGTPSPYEEGWAKLKGTPAPQDAGQGMIGVQGAITPAEPDMTEVDTLIGDELGDLKQSYVDFFDAEEQKKSLFDYAKPFQKEIAGIDEQIIDAQSIIEGTEDDIRNEVEMAGGFGTDSQVQALALSRNKALLKNYNNLVALRQSKTDQLNMMINLADKDRAYALQKFDAMMNWGKFEAQFRQSAKQNALDQYNKYDPITLQAMLANNPRQLAFYESISGVGQGGLAKLANAYKQSPEYKLNKAQLYNQQLENKKLENELGIGGTAGVSRETAKGQIDTVEGLLNNTAGLEAATGTTGFFGRGGLIRGAVGKKSDFTAGVQQLTSQLTLDNLIAAKAKGATFGALSEGELSILAGGATKLNTWAKKDKSGNIIGFKTTEKNIRAELDQINYYAKKDFIKKGGDPTKVGVITMPDGKYWTLNSDGTYSEIQME